MIIRIFRACAACCAAAGMALPPPLLPLAAFASPAQAAILDDEDHSPSLQKPARRVISLYGAFNDLLLALGAGDLIVARAAADCSTPALARLPSIGTHMMPNLELVIAARPDLVLQIKGRGEASAQAASLREHGLNVLTFEIDSFEQLFSALRRLGSLVGKDKEAALLEADWRGRLEALRARHAGKKPVSFFYEARYPNLLGAGQKGIVNDIMEAAGGSNIVAIPKKLVRLSEEALIQGDPDVYIMQKGPMNPGPDAPSQRENYKNLRAVKAGRVLTVDEKLFSRPGPASIEAAEKMEKWLWQEKDQENVKKDLPKPF